MSRNLHYEYFWSVLFQSCIRFKFGWVVESQRDESLKNGDITCDSGSLIANIVLTAHTDSCKSFFSPIRSPGVLDQEVPSTIVGGWFILSCSNNRNCMSVFCAAFIANPMIVDVPWFCIEKTPPYRKGIGHLFRKYQQRLDHAAVVVLILYSLEVIEGR